MFVAVAASLLVGLVASQTLPPNSCGGYMTCQSCVRQSLCGWCSLPVIYPGNITGPQCAGFSPNHKQPFACNGIYSTETCISGYQCNMSTFTCQQSQPGSGIPLAECESQCVNNGQVYLCNTTTLKCYQVPPGTPGAQSLSLCENSCTHPSSSPSSPQPTQPSLYVCNYTSGQCVMGTPGQGTSLQVCEQECQKTNGTEYICNSFLNQCDKLPPNTPGGYSYQQCEEICIPHPNPGPPPALTLGVYRGVAIQNGYTSGEYDMNITETNFTMEFTTGNGQITTITGVPYYINTSSQNEMWIQLNSGPSSGQYWKSITDICQEPGPETGYITIAFSAVGQPAPSSIQSGMTASGGNVFAMGKCLAAAPECVFTMPNVQWWKSRTFASLENKLKKNLQAEHLDHQQKHINGEPPNQINDHCTVYGQNCTYCLAHEYCGWCSVDVVYNSGQVGTQCAGFNPNNQSEAFSCSGRYSTLNCTVGYECDEQNYQCVETQPGNGMPQRICEQLCHPTQPPPPPSPLYTCNITTKQCFLCNTSNTTHYCPGGLPLQACESGCVTPKPGPSGNIIGIWRGVHIQNNYPLGETDFVFNASAVTVYNRGVLNYTADIISLGADVMLFTITSGPLTGQKFGNIYQLSYVAQDMYTFMTFGEGILDEQIPADFATAMVTPGMRVLILAKCNEDPCTFHMP